MAMAPEDENPPVVSPKIFSAVQLLEVDLCDCTDAELRPVLASLVRMSLIASLDKSTRCIADRTKVLEVLSRYMVYCTFNFENHMCKALSCLSPLVFLPGLN